MGLLPASKKWKIKDFVLAGTHEHYQSADTVTLAHNGDYIKLGTANQPLVASITISIRKYTRSYEVHAIGGPDDYKNNYETGTEVLTTGKIYEYLLKEQYQEGNRFIENVDKTITLTNVAMADGSNAVIGQEPTTEGGIPWDVILSALGWVAGIAAVVLGAYVAYRVYRWRVKGEQLFPRFQAMIKGGD